MIEELRLEEKLSAARPPQVETVTGRLYYTGRGDAAYQREMIPGVTGA
jgi:hypothetical protein